MEIGRFFGLHGLNPLGAEFPGNRRKCQVWNYILQQNVRAVAELSPQSTPHAPWRVSLWGFLIRTMVLAFSQQLLPKDWSKLAASSKWGTKLRVPWPYMGQYLPGWRPISGHTVHAARWIHAPQGKPVFNWKPVQGPKQWLSMSKPVGSRYNTSQSILDSLQPLQLVASHTKEDWVGIVKSASHQGTG